MSMSWSSPLGAQRPGPIPPDHAAEMVPLFRLGINFHIYLDGAPLFYGLGVCRKREGIQRSYHGPLEMIPILFQGSELVLA